MVTEEVRCVHCGRHGDVSHRYRSGGHIQERGTETPAERDPKDVVICLPK